MFGRIRARRNFQGRQSIRQRVESFGRQITVMDTDRQDSIDDAEALLNLYLIISTLMLTVFVQFFTILAKEDIDTIANYMEDELKDVGGGADWKGHSEAQNLVWWSNLGIWMMIFAMMASISMYFNLNMSNCREEDNYFQLWFAYYKPVLLCILLVIISGNGCLLVVFLCFQSIRYAPDTRTQVLVFYELWRTSGLPDENIPAKSWGRNWSLSVFGTVIFVFVAVYVIYASYRVTMVDKKRRNSHASSDDTDACLYDSKSTRMEHAVRTLLLSKVHVSNEAVSALEREKVFTMEDLHFVSQDPSLVRRLFPCVGDYCRFARLLPHALSSCSEHLSDEGEHLSDAHLSGTDDHLNSKDNHLNGKEERRNGKGEHLTSNGDHLNGKEKHPNGSDEHLNDKDDLNDVAVSMTE